MWPGASSRLRAASDSAGISRFRGAVRVESAILCFKRDAATCDAALFQPDLRGHRRANSKPRAISLAFANVLRLETSRIKISELSRPYALVIVQLGEM
jgi:hypothetical protein